MKSRIPPAIDQGKRSESCMSYLHHHYTEFVKLRDEGKNLVTDTAERYVCGFPVPAFQRGLVWTQEQNVAFIESAWLGIPLGTYNTHAMDWEGNEAEAKHFSGWLIDGQQRLTAIEGYWNDKFKVFGLLWSELTVQEKRRFTSIKFSYFESSLWDEALIRDLYNRMAFGGTPHKIEEMA